MQDMIEAERPGQEEDIMSSYWLGTKLKTSVGCGHSAVVIVNLQSCM